MGFVLPAIFTARTKRSQPSDRNSMGSFFMAIVPPEPKLPYRLCQPNLEHHATALGYVCMEFAALELSLSRLIEQMLRCSPEVRRAIIDATGLSISTRCDLLLKLASIDAPTRDWIASLEWLAGIIKDEISPKRNRLVHDAWFGGDPPTQLDERAILKSPQSFQPKIIPAPTNPERTLESVWDLVKTIQYAQVGLGVLYSNLRARALGVPQSDIPELFLPPRKQNTPDAPQGGDAKKSPPPES